jgi:hypothetical protein
MEGVQSALDSSAFKLAQHNHISARLLSNSSIMEKHLRGMDEALECVGAP